MVSRFINLIENLGGELIFAVPANLRRVMSTFKTSAELITVGDDIQKVDFHLPLMSLPHITREKWNKIPTSDSYLSVPSESKKKWQSKLGETKSLRVGLVCRGNPRHLNDLNRGLNLADLIAHLPSGPEYHLLQKDINNAELKTVEKNETLLSHASCIEDFADTAALCASMDLIISVDTSVIHLAGALGLPAIVMVPFWPDWRWGLNGSTNDWYPNTLVARQLQMRDWSNVYHVAALEIQRLVDQKDSAVKD